MFLTITSKMGLLNHLSKLAKGALGRLLCECLKFVLFSYRNKPDALLQFALNVPSSVYELWSMVLRVRKLFLVCHLLPLERPISLD